MRFLASLLAFIFLLASPAAPAEPQWMTLPQTPELPTAKTSGIGSRQWRQDLVRDLWRRRTRDFAAWRTANSDPSGVADISTSKVFNDHIARAEKEYQALSPTPDQYKSFLDQIGTMCGTQPKWTADNLRTITVPTWIVDGDHDEAIKRENTEFMAASVPGAGLLLQPDVSHFSFMQDSKQFNDDLLHFLEHVKGQ